MIVLTVLGLAAASLTGCGPDYSPDTYTPNAVQQANKVERGVVIGVRQIGVNAAGVVGAATGAAAGSVAGAQAPGGNVGSAFGAIGGGLVGGLLGSSVERAVGDTDAYEYIVRKDNNELVSVTQKDATPLKVGARVLVIAGSQARIVPDYTVELATPPASPPAPSKPAEAPAPLPAPVAATPLPALKAEPPPAAAPEPASQANPSPSNNTKS
jgi:outer membrane lipoprotein SlyB